MAVEMGNEIGKRRADVNWTPLPVPWAVQTADRIPKQRYYDPDFYALENEMFWPRVWQMACRLEEIPKPGDFVEYEILDESIIVVRVDSENVRAYHNACRHRGVKLVEGNGNRRTFVCPFHGWCWGIDGRNTFVLRPEEFAEENMSPDDIQLVSVRCELWGGCAWINLDEGAPVLRDCLEPFASIYDAWKTESLRVEWWQSCRLPVNWKLATAAFMEGYHVPQTHPQLLPSAQIGSPSPAVHPVVASSLYFMRTLGTGMGGMTHENDIRIAEGLQNIELPADPAEAMTGAATCPISTIWFVAGSPTRSASASRTTSSCPPTAAPRRTESVRWAPRRPCSKSGPSPVSPRTFPPASPHHRSPWRPTTPAGRRSRHKTSPICRDSKKGCTLRDSNTCACRIRSKD
jgi:glycine betaine catabolism A